MVHYVQGVGTLYIAAISEMWRLFKKLHATRQRAVPACSCSWFSEASARIEGSSKTYDSCCILNLFRDYCRGGGGPGWVALCRHLRCARTNGAPRGSPGATGNGNQLFYRALKSFRYRTDGAYSRVWYRCGRYDDICCEHGGPV